MSTLFHCSSLFMLTGSNAVIVAIGGLLSSLIGGFISDYLASPPPRADGSPARPRARAWVAAIGEQDA